jgi:hypothetical protein
MPTSDGSRATHRELNRQVFQLFQGIVQKLIVIAAGCRPERAEVIRHFGRRRSLLLCGRLAAAVLGSLGIVGTTADMVRTADHPGRMLLTIMPGRCESVSIEDQDGSDLHYNGKIP